MHKPHILHVCTGRAQPLQAEGGTLQSGIRKTAIAGPVAASALGLQGDGQADLSVHGGQSKAIYAYPAEHLPFWQTVRAQAGVQPWGEALPPGLLGENLLLQGLLETDLWVGDRLVLPDFVLTVSGPRFPCFKFTAIMGFKQAAKMMVESDFCGSYLAVLVPGAVQAGDAIELQPGPREVNIRALFLRRVRPRRG